MSRIKLLVVAAVVAALALSATAASASAHTFKVEGSTLTGTKNLKSKSFAGNFVLSGKPFLVAVHIECTKVHVTGSLGAGGTGTATLEFSSCTVTKPANCKVKEPIVTSVNTNLITGTGGLENEFVPPTGSPFTTVTLEGASCSLKTPFEVTGSQDCGLPGAGIEAVGHEIKCETTGSKLEAGAKPATFEGTISGLELETAEKWSAE